jgi:serine-type D-Ala-D-Ala carboxypeptidase/endopeptidase (penicillin-binding protein 4)
MINIQWPRITLYFSFLILLASCSVSKQISKTANADIFSNKELSTAHIGISIFDPATGNYLYNHQGDKYFIPASNTKIPTCYAAMKYLGDSLVGLRYEFTHNGTSTTFVGTGDPTFMHPDFKNQPVFAFLKSTARPSYWANGPLPRFSPFGRGWAWDDYQSDYAPERSEMPIYGNVVRFFIQADTVAVMPSTFYNGSIRRSNSTLKNGVGPWFSIVRPDDNSSFHTLNSDAAYKSKTKFSSQVIPFKTITKSERLSNFPTVYKLLEDTLHTKIEDTHTLHGAFRPQNKLHSQPTDSMLKIMMHRSDNFFAEQTLLMVSNELLGYMSDSRVIDTILKTDFKDLPQKPKWVDGSGLSRYNLFTPQDFVAILNKMKNEFGMDRVKTIFPTGGKGTLSSFYKDDSGFIFAKTGTLSNNVALSGFLYTKHGKLLIFSVQVNNHMTSATEVRKAVEKFLQGIRNKY